MDKETFHRTWARNLRRLATALGLVKGQFTVRSNKGGDGVLGEVTLHSDTLYLQVGGSCCGPDKPDVMYRSCEGQKDYTGGYNRRTTPEALLAPGGLSLLRAAMAASGKEPRYGGYHSELRPRR